MWHGKRKSSNLVEHGRELLKTNPLYSEDFIMENGVQLTIRTYKMDSTIRIDGGGYDRNIDVENGDIVYLLNNKLHRVNGPALNGKPHRDGGPAIIFLPSIEIYYKNGHLHRIDGPARIENNQKEWWIEGIYMKTEEHWLNETRRIKLDDILSICRLCG